MADKIILKFPDGSEHEHDKGISAADVAKSIGEGLARAAVAAQINGEIVDLNRQIQESGDFRILTERDPEALEVLRHSTAHVMAEAVVSLFPYAKPTIGPVVSEGFYYDFDHEPFTPEDLERIEKKMQEIIDADLPFERLEVSPEQAKNMCKDNKFKLELIDEFAKEDKVISMYQQGDFNDLCRGPHLPSTKRIKAFKLTKLAGAYWRGDAKNAQLQRIYGISFFDRKDLKKHLEMIEEAEKRDHRKLGKRLDLFSIQEEGPGFPFFHPKGLAIWDEMIAYNKELLKKYGYVEIKTPVILNRALWETSGHWMNYRENMYTLKIDDQDYAIKPMNCPGGMLQYKTRIHSYREFPLRVAEIGLVHRHELSGVLAGLFRVRVFHQDDAHIFMTEDHIKQEVLSAIKYAEELYSTFGLSYSLELSTRPEKSIGSDEQWALATEGLRGALEATGKEYVINEGDGAFYGPKIDFHLKDAIGRTWQCGTIQLDMSLPERFDLAYEGEDGRKHRPVMIHRAIYGSLERFLGILIEHYAGKFPLWLSPVQVKLLPVADRHMKYAEELKRKFMDAGLRVEVDERSESIPKKVRDAQLEYVCYILVVGDAEEKNKTANVRTRDNHVHGEKKVDDIISELKKEIADRK